MKYLQFYKDQGIENDKVFDGFIGSVRTSIKVWVLPVNLVFVVLLFFNLINVYILEKRYSTNILIAMENL